MKERKRKGTSVVPSICQHGGAGQKQAQSTWGGAGQGPRGGPPKAQGSVGLQAPYAVKPARAEIFCPSRELDRQAISSAACRSLQSLS